jgi:hypothetical protein
MSSTTNWPLGSRVSTEPNDSPKDAGAPRKNLPAKNSDANRSSTYERLSDSLQSRTRSETKPTDRPVEWLGSTSKTK